MRACAACGKPNSEAVQSCVECGAQLPDAHKKALIQTVLGMPSPVASSGEAAGASPPPPASATAPDARSPAGRALGGTMIGLPTPPRVSGGPTPSPPAALPPGNQAETPPPAQSPRAQALTGTLLGVARPGIAPASGPQAAPREASKVPAPAPPHGATSPAPSEAGPLKSSPNLERVSKVQHRSPRGGQFPWALLGAGLTGAALLGGFVAWLDKKDARLAVTSFEVKADGGDILTVSCTDCPDGSSLTWGNQKANFQGKTARIDAPSKLVVGENLVRLSLQPKGGEEEEVELVVPIAFRIDTLLDGLRNGSMEALLRVEAPPSARVAMDGTAVPLKAGRAERRFDFSAEVRGERPDRLKVARKIPITVASDQGESQSHAFLEFVVTPLEILTPGLGHSPNQVPLTILGRTSPRARVRLGDKETMAGPDGLFDFELTERIEPPLQLSAQLGELATRLVDLPLTPRDTSEPWSSEAKLGSQVVLQGKVIEKKIHRGTSQLALEVESGCPAPPCVVAVRFGSPIPARTSARVKVLGQVVALSPPALRADRIEAPVP